MLYAKRIAQGKGIIIPDEAKANSAAMSAWIDSNRGTKRRKRGRKTGGRSAMASAWGAKASAGRARRLSTTSRSGRTGIRPRR
jgi:DNA topoisomerase-3